ncbi:MAG: PEP-utilizing enzyme [Planctomycetota bacterium]|nr:PEP-utilizing enzyme [Planctomycetota bacterium]
MQVLDGKDEVGLITQVCPGAIVVARITTSGWDAALGTIHGLITSKGNEGSHPAIRSRELQIPAVVRVANATELLRRYDRQVVTLDSSRRVLFIGTMPIREQVRSLALWRDLSQPQEKSRATDQNIANDPVRPANTICDFEGQWFPCSPWRKSLFRLWSRHLAKG